jgi:anaerobic magnesium-protoporphyrin IX monomethyl ester cyclase
MNVLLVRGKPTFMDFIVGIPIGLAYIAPVAQRRGHHVEILDLALERNPEPVLEGRLRERPWDLAGFSCMTAEWDGAVRAAQAIKAYDPSIRTIFGGQHPTIETQEVLSQDFADMVCVGEGEATFAEVLERLDGDGDLAGVDGLAYKDPAGESRRNRPRPPIEDVDSIPYPAYELLDIDRYAVAESARHTPRHKRAIQIFTSRGCPWHCTYCHDLFGKKFHPRSPEHVLGEMRLLYERYDIREFMIEDDIFNFDMDRAKRICDLLVESGMKVSMQFGNGVRLERLDEELIRKLAAAGTHHMCIAIESASPRIQKLSKKYLKLHQVKDVARWSRKYGIETLGFFMIGFPTETVEEIEMTIRFACETELDEALFSIVIPYPGTELSHQIIAEQLYDETDHLNRVHRIRTREFDFKTLKRLQRKAYILFFLTRFRFVRMLPKLLRLRSSLKYLRAIERNLLPAFLRREASRIN